MRRPQKPEPALRLGPTQIECLYCSRTIPRMTQHATCPICAARWRREFGAEWHTAPWHAAMIADHRRALSAPPRPLAQLAADLADPPPLDLLTGAYVPQARHRPAWVEAQAIIAAARLLGRPLGRVALARELRRRGVRDVPAPATLQAWIDVLR